MMRKIYDCKDVFYILEWPIYKYITTFSKHVKIDKLYDTFSGFNDIVHFKIKINGKRRYLWYLCQIYLWLIQNKSRFIKSDHVSIEKHNNFCEEACHGTYLSCSKESYFCGFLNMCHQSLDENVLKGSFCKQML